MSSPMPIPWPMSAQPGRRPGDGQGDLINSYAVKLGDITEIRRTPGLIKRWQLADASDRIPRGMHAVQSRFYHAWDGEIRQITDDGEDIPVTGALLGSDRVTMAHNMRDGTPNIVVVCEAGTFLIDIDTNTITTYPDPLGNLNQNGNPFSVEYFSGYFVFPKLSGYFSVSDLQNPEIPDGSYGKSEYTADTLWRAKANNSVLLLMSSASIEAWVDVATMPMPFQRQTALDVGLLGPWAVAGGSNEWERGVLFVASDYTVRMMDGLTPKIVSNDDVSYDIYGCRDVIDQLFAQVYTFEQQAVFSISCIHAHEHRSWTWEFNVNTGAWHRRDSYGQDHWRCTSAASYKNRWYSQDYTDAKIYEIAQEIFDEDGQRMRARIESGPMKAFPASMRVPSIDIDCIVGLGRTRVPSPFQTNPCMEVSWSHDGGANWSRPVTRSMGRTGHYANKVTVNNLGRSTHHGVRIRCDVVDPVPATILSGVSVATKPSRARQVYK